MKSLGSVTTLIIHQKHYQNGIYISSPSTTTLSILDKELILSAYCGHGYDTR
jgi:hypothetical protein